MKLSRSGKGLLITLASAGLCLGAIYDNFADLPTAQYDFIVVGSGAGGNVIANRLTENPKFSVLLLEAGPSNEGVINSMVPFFTTLLRSNSPFDWNYTLTPQDGLNGRVLTYPRGHLLGGSTAINGMAYTRGTPEDYGRYARITRDPGWSWDNLQPYIRKNERWVPPVDHHNTTGQFDPSIHGFHGVNSVSLSGFLWKSISERVIQTTTQLNHEFPFNLDTNSGNVLGVAWTQLTIKGGERSSSATSYLGPEFIRRPNLHVLVNARVTRILQTSPGHGVLAFKAVEFVQSVGGPRRRVTASREVVLSAGAVGTPQILMNSGIGDKTELTQLGVQSRVHLPDVGKNLTAHVSLPVSYFVNSTDTYDDIVRNATLRAELFQIWNRTRTGPLVDSILNHVAYVRMPNNATIFRTNPDPAAGPHSPHFQFSIENGLFSNPSAMGHFITLALSVITPTSRGSVKLNTSNPFDQPLIDVHSLTTDFDIFAMREGIKTAQRFLSAPAWKGYVLAPFGGLANITTDVQLDQFIRATAAPNGHIVGTASMSPRGAQYGVVDPDLRVKGVTGLRVVDASVMPFIPASNTQAPVYIIAERAADLIKAAWK